jgi:hypothetical protein
MGPPLRCRLAIPAISGFSQPDVVDRLPQSGESDQENRSERAAVEAAHVASLPRWGVPGQADRRDKQKGRLWCRVPPYQRLGHDVSVAGVG